MRQRPPARGIVGQSPPAKPKNPKAKNCGAGILPAGRGWDKVRLPNQRIPRTRKRGGPPSIPGLPEAMDLGSLRGFEALVEFEKFLATTVETDAEGVG